MVGEDLLSVVITAHNEESTIERAILSIANQSYANIEIIIVNDGSTDSTQKTIKELTTRLNGITVLNNEYATGLMAARNLGVANANGKFIAFLDGDDEWASRKAEIQLPVLVDLQRGAILFTARIVYSIKGIPFIFGKKSVSNELFVYDYNQVLSKNGIFHMGASMMLERSTFETLGGFDEKAGKERDLIARVGVMGGTIAWLGTPLYIQHRKLNSMSTDIKQTYRRELDMISQKSITGNSSCLILTPQDMNQHAPQPPSSRNWICIDTRYSNHLAMLPIIAWLLLDTRYTDQSLPMKRKQNTSDA